MRQKLTKDEQQRINTHRRVAPPIPEIRQPKSLAGQTFFEFTDAFSASNNTRSTHLLPLAASPVLSSGLPSTMAQV